MVKTVKFDWHDAQRGRVVPVKIFFPDDARAALPVILFSHGLGSSRDVYGYLGRHWASRGYLSVHLQHIGSDSAVWEKFPVAERTAVLHRAAQMPENSINRPNDVSFAIDELTRLNEHNSPFDAPLNLEQIGVAGHSYGAFTALASVGEIFVTSDGEKMSFRDPRIKAAIAMSSPIPRNKNLLDFIYSQIKAPCFHITGTNDDSPFGDTIPAERRIPFDHISAPNQFLLTFRDADHFVFSGRWRDQPGGERDAMFQEFIKTSTTAFWDAFLKNDSAALNWLKNGFAKELGNNGVLEMK